MFSNASSKYLYVNFLLLSFNISISLIVASIVFQLFRIRLIALYGESSLQAAFNLGHNKKLNISLSKSSLILLSISFLNHFDLDFFNCFNHASTIILFSHTRFIQSATVQRAAISRVSSIYSCASFSSKNSFTSADISLKATQAHDNCLNG